MPVAQAAKEVTAVVLNLPQTSEPVAGVALVLWAETAPQPTAVTEAPDLPLLFPDHRLLTLAAVAAKAAHQLPPARAVQAVAETPVQVKAEMERSIPEAEGEAEAQLAAATVALVSSSSLMRVHSAQPAARSPLSAATPFTHSQATATSCRTRPSASSRRHRPLALEARKVRAVRDIITKRRSEPPAT
jgi:hypothetical protein